MKIKILFVCLGNICRSPAAEAVFMHLACKKGLQKRFQVDSAGTGGWHVGQPPDERMRQAAQKRGITLTSLARQINLNDFNNYDLILTMDNDNLLSVKTLKKQVSKSKVDIRPILSFLKKSNYLEVPDPYYGGDQGFDNVLDLLEESCNRLIDELSNEE